MRQVFAGRAAEQKEALKRFDREKHSGLGGNKRSNQLCSLCFPTRETPLSHSLSNSHPSTSSLLNPQLSKDLVVRLPQPLEYEITPDDGGCAEAGGEAEEAVEEAGAGRRGGGEGAVGGEAGGGLGEREGGGRREEGGKERGLGV